MHGGCTEGAHTRVHAKQKWDSGIHLLNRKGSMICMALVESSEAVAAGSARRKVTLCRVCMVIAAAARQLSFTSSMARIVITHIPSRCGSSCAQRLPCNEPSSIGEALDEWSHNSKGAASYPRSSVPLACLATDLQAAGSRTLAPCK